MHPNKGSAIIMDIHDTNFEHGVNAVTNKTKYIISMCFYATEKNN